MQLDDMILVSIDDHVDRAAGHVRAPRPGQVRGPGAEGRPQRPDGSTSGSSRAQATSTRFGHGGDRGLAGRGVGPQPGHPSRSCGPDASTSTSGSRDMNANGVLASMCFPTMAGFNARTFTESARQGPLAA